MTRALAQSILDPIYLIINHEEYKKSPFFFISALIASFITIFCSCVYNEVLVLYCCGLEKNTHLEIAKQTDNFELHDTIENEENEAQEGPDDD